MSLVSIIQAETIDTGAYKKAIEKSLNLLDFSLKGKPKKILIKPNLCYYYDYSTGETTDPKFVGAIVDVLRDGLSTDPDIFIIESDASAMRCKYVFRMLGYEKLAKDKDITLVNLSKQKNVIVDINILDEKLKFNIPTIFEETNLLINVPKIKYQTGSKITCALKNIYGCNSYRRKDIYHRYLSEAIVGINKLIKSDLVIVDGIVSKGVETKRLGLVMASEDPVAIDTIASKILGLNPMSIKHISLASKEGLGNMEYKIIGDNLEYFMKIYPKKRMKNKTREALARIYFRYFN